MDRVNGILADSLASIPYLGGSSDIPIRNDTEALKALHLAEQTRYLAEQTRHLRMIKGCMVFITTLICIGIAAQIVLAFLL